MCGILGGNYEKWDYEKALKTIYHRGPDAQQIKSVGDVTLGFTRLAIIDLSEKGMQPMADESGRVWITYNGEIYGYAGLKEKLKKKGYHFHSSSDTEVLLNAYLEYGDDFIHRIDGIFAIALWDMRTQQIKLFRDRPGVKPLYYFMAGDYFAFASELKAITALCDNISFKTDNTAIYDYLTYTYIPDPKTMYQNVFKLPPACMIVYDVGRKRITKKIRYYDVKPCQETGRRRKQEDIEEELRYLIGESVREQMAADVPVGSFLSGGVDSSIITYEAYRLNRDIETFSIGFTDKNYDELTYAHLLADSFHIRRNERIMDGALFYEMRDRLKLWYDEPYADTSAYPTYMVSALAKEKVTVVLTGDGGDELFGGYTRYRNIKDSLKKQQNNSRFLSNCYELLCLADIAESGEDRDRKYLDEVAACVKSYGYMMKTEKESYAKALGIGKGYDDYWFFRKYYIRELPIYIRLQYLDYHTYLPGDILTKVDRTSMRVSLEARVPLLSKRITDFAFSLSEEERIPEGELKGLLKSAYSGVIPERILYRKKQGFSIPTYFLTKRKKVSEELLERVWKWKKGL